ncbi:MAG TPA: VC0807 family protein [Pseudonocardiaceae bacterium]|jgi:hypothetical protein|nr:VC0807 family protein [Pseudonocardiaceae bacterium]
MAGTPRSAWLLPVLLDLVIPVAGYYLLHALGMSTFLALTVSGAATGINALFNTVRQRRLDAIGLLVVLEIALSVTLLFSTHDPRIALLKPGFYTAAAGMYALFSCWVGRPLVYEAGKPFASRGDPRRLAGYERAWVSSRRFRRVISQVTVGWGITFLLDSLLRTVIVLHFPATEVTDSLVLSQAPSVLLLVLVVVFTRLRMRSVRSIIDERSPGD